MKLLLPILLFISVTASAEVLRIESIDQGQSSAEPDHLYLSDGRVAVVTSDKMNLTPEVGSYVNIDLDKNHEILEISLAKKPLQKSIGSSAPVKEYVPTVLPNLDSVNSIFRKMNRGWQRDSQCYNRAHVWNYEEYVRSGLLSKKVFIFYTRRYIRDYNFKWWFHAIPTVLAQHEGTIVERYLDPMFARTHLTRKAWTDIFIKSRRDCPVITKYSQYRDNQETEHCYLHFASMYYWQPRDLDKFERTGVEKNSFIRSEVNHAYWEAF